MTVHYRNKFGILEDDGTFVPFREEDQEKILNATWQKWLTKNSAAARRPFYWQPPYGQSYEIEGGKEAWCKCCGIIISRPDEYGVCPKSGKYDLEYRYLPKREESKISTGDSHIFLLDEQANRIEVDGLVYVREVKPEQESQEEDWELLEMIAKVHDDVDGRYDLTPYDKSRIHELLCKTRKPK